MKKHTMALALGLFALVGNLTACTQEASEATTEPADTATAQQDIITTPLGANLMAWPAGPIAWDGLVGTWPIAVWSPLPISMLAFDVAGVSSLTLGISTLNAAGTTALLGINALPISTPFFGCINAGLGTPWLGAGVYSPTLGAAGLYAPAYGFDGAFSPLGLGTFGFGGFDGALGGISNTVVGGALTTGIGVSPFLTPAITTNALMFTNLAALTTMSPYLINVGFTGVAGLNSLMMGGLSLFASTAAANVMLTGTFPFTSLAFPIMSPLGVGLGSPLLL